ncbi:membrane protein, partial [Vibrio cholerae]
MLAPQGFDCTYVMLTPSELDDIKNVSFGSLTIDSQL